MSLPLHDITEGRELLARSKAGEPGARQALGAWFEAWGGMVLDAFERILAPLPDPRRRFCPECGNRSFWPHTSWCSRSDMEPTGDRKRTGGGLSDADLLQRSAATGITEIAAEAYAVYNEEMGDTVWENLDPDTRNAWRLASKRIWEMAR